MGTSEQFAVQFGDSIDGEHRVRFRPKTDGSGHWVMIRETRTSGGWSASYAREIRSKPSVAFGEDIER